MKQHIVLVKMKVFLSSRSSLICFGSSSDDSNSDEMDDDEDKND